jgi:hypothetical protein
LIVFVWMDYDSGWIKAMSAGAFIALFFHSVYEVFGGNISKWL